MKWNASINFIFYIFFSIMLFDKIQCFLFHYQKKGWIFINSFHIFQQLILFCINYNFVVILMYLFHYACWRTIFIPLSILNDKLQWISINFILFFVKKKRMQLKLRYLKTWYTPKLYQLFLQSWIYKTNVCYTLENILFWGIFTFWFSWINTWYKYVYWLT